MDGQKAASPTRVRTESSSHFAGKELPRTSPVAQKRPWNGVCWVGGSPEGPLIVGGTSHSDEGVLELPPDEEFASPNAIDSRAAVKPKWRLPDVETLRAMSAGCTYRRRVLADRLGVSERHLRRLFYYHLRISPERWLLEERLQAGRRLLTLCASVKEVAYTLGFNQSNQFSRDFRRRFGCTPLEFMRFAAESSASSRPSEGPRPLTTSGLPVALVLSTGDAKLRGRAEPDDPRGGPQ
jgi:AraC-like DNA-binding protein